MNINLLKNNKHAIISAIIRVNHAGEYGAKRIYDGQLRTLHDESARAQVAEMQAQESAHLQYFEQQIPRYKVRPTILLPLWHVGGFALGAITGLLGKRTAMLCTDAVEEVIAAHYQSQIDELNTITDIVDLQPSVQDLTQNITKFRAEELQHQHIANDGGVTYNFAEQLLYKATQTICKTAIKLSKIL